MGRPIPKMDLHELNALTYGMVANVDANIGRLLAKLKELGIEDNTIVIFMSKTWLGLKGLKMIFIPTVTA